VRIKNTHEVMSSPMKKSIHSFSKMLWRKIRIPVEPIFSTNHLRNIFSIKIPLFVNEQKLKIFATFLII
jgi:hypothetical protein